MDTFQVVIHDEKTQVSKPVRIHYAYQDEDITSAIKDGALALIDLNEQGQLQGILSVNSENVLSKHSIEVDEASLQTSLHIYGSFSPSFSFVSNEDNEMNLTKKSKEISFKELFEDLSLRNTLLYFLLQESFSQGLCSDIDFPPSTPEPEIPHYNQVNVSKREDLSKHFSSSEGNKSDENENLKNLVSIKNTLPATTIPENATGAISIPSFNSSTLTSTSTSTSTAIEAETETETAACTSTTSIANDNNIIANGNGDEIDDLSSPPPNINLKTSPQRNTPPPPPLSALQQRLQSFHSKKKGGAALNNSPPTLGLDLKNIGNVGMGLSSGSPGSEDSGSGGGGINKKMNAIHALISPFKHESSINLRLSPQSPINYPDHDRYLDVVDGTVSPGFISVDELANEIAGGGKGGMNLLDKAENLPPNAKDFFSRNKYETFSEKIFSSKKK